MPPGIAETREIWLPILTFLLGFFARTFTLSKADRELNERSKFALSKELADSQNETYQALMRALTEYSAQSSPPSLNDFFTISGPSQNYLYQQKLTADAILAGRVDAQSRDATFVPKLVETADILIPKIYGTLKKIADKHDLPYPDEFDRANYQSIFDAVEKYRGRESVDRLSG
jgi:hypothetical protein